MKFEISTQEFTNLVNKIYNLIPPKPTNPILSNFRITANDDELILMSTDLSVGIQCIGEAKIIEEGSTTLPAKSLLQLLRELTSPYIQVSTNSHDVTTLIAGSSQFKINGMSSAGFPNLPDFDESNQIVLKQKDLKELLSNVSFAISKDDNRYVLTGASMQIANDKLTFLGTDGKRLARSSLTLETPTNIYSQSTIPLKAVEEIVKNLNDEGDVTIHIMPDKISVAIDKTLLIAKLLTGEYPDIQRVIPEKSDHLITLHREELSSLMRQVFPFTSPDHLSTKFSFEDGELRLMSNTTNLGEGNLSMPVNYHDSKIEIAFNPLFINEILRRCKNEVVTLGIIDSYNPGVITDGEGPVNQNEMSPLFIIMPMRLFEN